MNVRISDLRKFFSLPISLKSSLLSKSAISILKKSFSSPQANDNIPGSKCSWTLSCKTKGHRFLIDIPTYFLPRASSLEPIPSDSPTELAPTSLWLSWFDNQHQRHFKVSINLAWSIPKRSAIWGHITERLSWWDRKLSIFTLEMASTF